MKKIIITLMLTSLSYAATPLKVSCSTPRNNVAIKIDGDKLSLKGRFPAETIAQRTKQVGNSITKVFFLAGEKHTIHLENKNQYSEFDDFINIKTRKGHEITFPLHCKAN